MTLLSHTDQLQFANATPIHQQAIINHESGLMSLTRMAFLSNVVDGSEPFGYEFIIDQPVAMATLLPCGAKIERCHTEGNFAIAFVSIDSSTHILITSRSTDATVAVSSASQAHAEHVASLIRSAVPAQNHDGQTKFRSWHLANHDRSVGMNRHITTPQWSDIQRNYTPPVSATLSRLFEMARPTQGGNLILWHGEPGTGKTSAIRALMREWEPWCAAQYIEDPEEFFSHPSYISEVLSRPVVCESGPTLTKASDTTSRWRLVICEDADQYLRATARRDSGAALGKLLNLADGILGQGLNTLILLTTNEELNRLHPAIIRPGRCLARIEFNKFTPTQARTWLPAGTKVPTSDASLAELFEISGTIQRIDAQPEANTSPVGQYL